MKPELVDNFERNTPAAPAGGIGKARPFWRRYVELEPHGTWAEIARKHL
jgi:hypothetical protein